MKDLNEQEIIAITLIFENLTENIKEEILQQLVSMRSAYWEETGPGFFSTIKLNKPLVNFSVNQMYSFTFNYPGLKYGGSYNCVIVNELELELEGITFGGLDWPFPDNIGLFEELKE